MKEWDKIDYFWEEAVENGPIIIRVVYGEKETPIWERNNWFVALVENKGADKNNINELTALNICKNVLNNWNSFAGEFGGETKGVWIKGALDAFMLAGFYTDREIYNAKNGSRIIEEFNSEHFKQMILQDVIQNSYFEHGRNNIWIDFDNEEIYFELMGCWKTMNNNSFLADFWEDKISLTEKGGIIKNPFSKFGKPRKIYQKKENNQKLACCMGDFVENSFENRNFDDKIVLDYRDEAKKENENIEENYQIRVFHWIDFKDFNEYYNTYFKIVPFDHYWIENGVEKTKTGQYPEINFDGQQFLKYLKGGAQWFGWNFGNKKVDNYLKQRRDWIEKQIKTKLKDIQNTSGILSEVSISDYDIQKVAKDNQKKYMGEAEIMAAANELLIKKMKNE